MFEALARIRHRRFRRDLSAYLDEMLSPGARRRLEEHLDACAVCRQDLAELRATRGVLADLPLAEVPRSFALAAAPEPLVIPRPAARRLEFGLRLATAGAAFALAVVVVGDFAGLPGGGGEEEEAPAARQPLEEQGAPITMEARSEDEAEGVTVAPTAEEETPPAIGYMEAPAAGAEEELLTPESAPAPAAAEEPVMEADTGDKEVGTPEALVVEDEGGPSREDVLRWAEIGLGAGVGILVLSWAFVLRHVRIRAQSQ